MYITSGIAFLYLYKSSAVFAHTHISSAALHVSLGGVYTRTFLETSVFESFLYCILYVCLHTSVSYTENGYRQKRCDNYEHTTIM